MRALPVLSLLIVFLKYISAIKFNLPAQPSEYVNQLCLRYFVEPNELIIVTASVNGHKGDGQRVNMEVFDLPELLIGASRYSWE